MNDYKREELFNDISRLSMEVKILGDIFQNPGVDIEEMQVLEWIGLHNQVAGELNRLKEELLREIDSGSSGR